MIINNTGTFYVEGDYAQGDTILTVGAFAIVADTTGLKKYAVAYDENTTPNPYAIKDELVTNGTFDTDLSGWNLVGNGSAAVVSGELQVTWGTSGPTTVGQTIQVDVGKSYEISWRAREVSGSGGLMRITGGVDLAVPIASTTDVEFSYIVKPTNNFTLFCRKDSAGTSAFDNISVKEVQQPLTLGNGNHKDFRYYPKTLSQNETEALTA